ncbi:hypothetical protein [Mesorhizobium sp.]|uniref:hypothetical protein n=1 Tax=Mesorhizobium sp. TaxID=1871066 RepID=UPI000FE5E06A|nr:hypothetical protein [Mesorhizobium sp.]RWQ65530.1 MAG: hypothetical protein EOS86_14585 [Mesorhizobium sp.]
MLVAAPTCSKSVIIDEFFQSVRHRSAFAHRDRNRRANWEINAIALEALCHMSNIVENPTTSAPPNHRINLRRQAVTPCRTRAVKLIGEPG